MFRLRNLLLLALLHECITGEFGYIRKFPAGITVVGTAVKMMAAEKVLDCAETWFNDSLVAISYNTTDQTCEGFSKVTGTQNEERTMISYLFTKSNDDVCSIDVSEDFNKIATCRDGWFKLIINGTAYCYFVLKKPEYEKVISSMHDIVFACKKLYPFSDSASIHSAEEEEALITSPTLLSILNPMNLGEVGIGMHLTPDNYKNYKDSTKWVWADKSPVTYVNWNRAYGCPYCSRSNTVCAYVVMMTDRDKWYQCDISWRRPMLCKYQLE
ncbi:hypothetical protein QR680_011695 [Steinernema hermaphroditum]|uniref:C-type lectin domain-containing protein n=1 Tax=Steinernema hermaphroditum TaxID=289476 RepID=A0AA39LYI7_9BILA|nr:hypothetical protein QR680_011695 [Steinernema hermaphroditum]